MTGGGVGDGFAFCAQTPAAALKAQNSKELKKKRTKGNVIRFGSGAVWNLPSTGVSMPSKANLLPSTSRCDAKHENIERLIDQSGNGSDF